MDIRNVLNDDDAPRRPPRPSLSTQNSQSPAADQYRHSSLQTSTPISPPVSSHPTHGTTHGYFDRQSSAFPSTPSSPHPRNPLATPHSIPSHASVDTPYHPSKPQNHAARASPHQEPTQRQREKSSSISPRTTVPNFSSQPLPSRFEHSHDSAARHESQDVTMGRRPTESRSPSKEAAIDSAQRREPSSKTHMKQVKRPLTEVAETSQPPAEVEPRAKRRRILEVPIWAKPAKNLRPLPKYNANGPKPNKSKPEVRAQTQPQFGSEGPLGPFEESFRGDFIPHEELTKQICDFLFQYVVMNDSIDTSKVGESAKLHGQLEIEAKIGSIIDKSTSERLRLPISSESILRSDYDVAFESMMTEQQHRSFNDLLNEALKDSRGPPVTTRRGKTAKARIHMSYEHRHEVDTFYELPDDETANLPQSLQALLKSRSSRRPTVRVTRHKKSGDVLAKIVKARVSDLHVVSPSTQFDWRVSVNIEANWDGDLEALVQASNGGAGHTHNSHPDRHKDRMSYTHQFCQIDLTQVKTSEMKDARASKGMPNITHELEVELDSSAVREQGQLVMQGMDNQYQELVKAFVDNVRILIRGVQ